MSELFKLNSKDFLRGLVVAVMTAVVSLLLKILENKGLSFDIVDLQTIVTTALVAGLSYLLKNLMTDDSGKLGGQLQIK